MSKEADLITAFFSLCLPFQHQCCKGQRNECLSITKFHICLLHWNETPEQSHIIHYKKFSPKQARHLQLYSPKHSTDSLITSNLISFRFSNNRLADRRPLWLLTASIPVYYTKTLTRHSRLKDPSGAAKTVYAPPLPNQHSQ